MHEIEKLFTLAGYEPMVSEGVAENVAATVRGAAV
jgi:hypothetical protein